MTSLIEQARANCVEPYKGRVEKTITYLEEKILFSSRMGFTLFKGHVGEDILLDICKHFIQEGFNVKSTWVGDYTSHEVGITISWEEDNDYPW